MNQMKSESFLYILMFYLLISSCQQKPECETIDSQLINFDWKFYYGDVENAYSPGFDDRQWENVDLPHDFQIYQNWVTPERDKKLVSDRPGDPRLSTYAPRGFKPMGIGWYRKTLKAPKSWLGKRIFIDFEGIMLVGDVWFNGVKVGKTDYGYLGFECDITEHIKFDAPNVIAVKANTQNPENARWYTGGGIYRDVLIVVRNSISIARHGVFISTPVITNEKAEVKIQIELENTDTEHDDIVLETRVYDPRGKRSG